jgi:hypothetical protein
VRETARHADDGDGLPVFAPGRAQGTSGEREGLRP